MLHSPASMIRVFPVAEQVERRMLLSVATGTMTSLTSADFNADGAPESLVWVSAGRVRLANLGVGAASARRGSLLLTDGSGAVIGGPLSLRARGNLAPATAAADFNEDGNLDLVVAGRRLSGVRTGLAFLAGNGDGTFATAVPIGGAPSNVTSLAAADVDGDGHVDLIGTARSRNGDTAASGGTRHPLVLDKPSRGDTDWTIIDDGSNSIPGSPDRPHAVGVGAEAGGGVLDGSATLPPEAAFAGGGDSGFPFGGFTFDLPVSVAPGFIPPAAQVGATAETGGARVGGFNDLLFPEEPFVLLGNGDGTFA